MSAPISVLQLLADTIENKALAMAWADYYKDHDRHSWDRTDEEYPDYYEPDEYRQRVIDALFTRPQ